MVRKILYYTFIAVGLLCGIARFVLPALININSYKPDIESALSDSLGIPLQITGTIDYTLWPDAQFFIKNIKADNDLVLLEEVEIGLDIYQLFKGKDYIHSIKIIKPHISLVRFKNGEFNFSKLNEETTDDEAGHSTSFALKKITITEGDIVYSDQMNETVTEVAGLHMTLEDMFVDTGLRESILQALSFRGTAYTKKINSPYVELSDLSFQVKATEGQYHIQPFFMTIFNGEAMGNMQLDLTGTTPHLDINASIAKFYLEEFAGEFSDTEFILGKSDFLLNLSLQGNSTDEAIKTARGSFSLLGDNLMVKQYDIDRILTNYRKSQKFGALDIGAFFLAGPLGTAVTKGYDLEEVYRGVGKGDGTIQKFISKWKVEKGAIIAEDVAFCTQKNRMALQGKLDLMNSRFDKVVAAVVDEKGCAEFTQKIYGSFDKPQFSKTTIFKSIAGAFLSLFRTTGKLIGKECKTFYSGSLAHPIDDVQS
jgi:AsmA protein